MKNSKRKLAVLLFTFIVTILLTIVGGQKVFAAHPNTISAIQEGKKVGGNTWFHVKTSGSRKVFCTSGLNVATPAGTGRSCSLIKSGQWSESNQAAIAAIISEYNKGRIKGYYDPYWYAEIAINKYLGNSVYSAGTDSLVQSLVSKAKNASKKAGTKFEATLSSSSIVFKKEGNYYVSNVITVKDKGGYLDGYDVTARGTKNVEIYNKKGNSFQVRFPASNVEIGKKVTVTIGVNAKKSYNVAQNYYCGSGVQNVTIDYLETRNISTYIEISGSVERKGNAIEIVKYNPYTGKNIAGATLVLKNSSGKQISSWVTTTSAKKFTNLPAGTYTLTETKAPNGYKKTSETVKITVKEDGKTIRVNFKNYPKTGANVLKIDGTTNKPVAGAKLVIKNAQGKVVKELVSTTQAIKVDLDAGTYTLTETEAPNGYKKTSEAVKFTVNKNGGYAEVKMKNYPKTGANVLKIDGTTNKPVAGAKLVIKNAQGKVVKELVSTTQAIKVDLDAGTYTLTETEAPNGYKKTSEAVKFTVNKNGGYAEVKMKNYPKTGVNVLKIDGTTNKPVAGAKLVIKNAQGKVVKELVSTTQAIKVDLDAGTYTLTETEAPNGYKKTSEAVKFTVNKNGGYAEVKMKNYPKTGANVLKIDGTTNKPVAGAKLVIKNAQGKVVKELVSTTQAIKVDLDAGTYTLTETEAPNGYKKTSEAVKFTVNKNGGYAEVKMKNYPKTGANVLKIDGTTNKPVAGAKLVIKNAQGKVVKELVSTTQAIKVDLDAGAYTLTETEAPNGYKKTSEAVKFTVNKNGGYAEVKMKNYPKTGANVLKIDGTTNKPVAGAKLVIKNAQGKVVKELVSTTQAIKVDLDAGTYTLTETEAPNGYKKTSEAVKFTVNKNGGYAEVKMKNYPKTGANVLKIDGTTNKPVAGAKLVIKNAQGKVVKELVSTTQAIKVDLDAGTYTLTETEAPNGYKKTSEAVKFTVNKNGGYAEVKMKNYPETGAEISKIDVTTGKELPGATLVIKDAKGKEVKSWVSTTEPTYFKLEPGKYTLTETIAPEGYKLSTETINFEVKEDGSTTKVTMENKPKTGAKISKQDITNKQELPGATLVIKDAKGKEVKSWVSTTEPTYFELEPGKYTLSETIAPEGYKLSTETIEFEVKEDGSTTEVVMYNEPMGTVVISKQDITNKQELPGATLVIKDAKGKEILKWVSLTTPKTFKLEPGKYTLSETISPKGYKLSTETINFEVKNDGSTTEVVMYNEPTKTGAKISKQDITNKQELPGATLVIKDTNGNEVKSWVSTTEPTYFELEPGKYTLSETIAPEGYKLSTETIEFEVKEDGSTTEVVMYNEPTKTGAKISKQDITNKQELPGATLVIKDANGNEVKSWVSTDKPHYIELQPGKYTLSETIAPVGYKLSTETIEFEVKEDGSTTEVVMYNEPSRVGVKISKQDITTKQELPGATLVIKDANGNEVAQWVSTSEPRYIELEPGEYMLTEISAPNGYDLSYEVVRFTVDAEGNATTDVVMYNAKTPVTSDKNILLTIIGFISAGIVGTVAIKKLKHQM